MELLKVVKVKKKRVYVSYDVTLGKRFPIKDIEIVLPEGGTFATDFLNEASAMSIRPGDFLSEDILEKSLKYLEYDVKRVMNITDVGHLSSDADTGEDKMLKGAKREKKTVLEIAEYYTNCFKEDCNKLNIKWPETVIPATSQIDEYIKFIYMI